MRQQSTTPTWVQMQQDDDNLINLSLDRECGSQFLAHFKKVEEARAKDQKAKYDDPIHQQRQQTNDAVVTSDVIAVERQTETWRKIDSKYFPQYVINDLGQIKNTCTNRILPSCTKTVPDDTVRRVTLTNKNGHEKTFTLHLLVAELFVPNPNPQWHSVYQFDNKKSNCRADNLFWGPQNATVSDLTKAANHHQLATSSSSLSRYNQRRHECGLGRPYTWSLRVKKQCFNDCRPYLTTFHPADLFADFGLMPASEQSFQREFGPSYAYARDTIEYCSLHVYKICELNWMSWSGESSQYRPVLVSMHGVVWDREQRLIGPGCVSLRHGKRKVFLPQLSQHFQASQETQESIIKPHKIPYHAVDTMVLEAWLGNEYWKYFLGQNFIPEAGFQVRHVNGNIHNNHIYNLLVVPNIADDEDIPSRDQEFQTLFTILDRVEPIWEYFEAHGNNCMPGITPSYARTILFKKLSQLSTEREA